MKNTLKIAQKLVAGGLILGCVISNNAISAIPTNSVKLAQAKTNNSKIVEDNNFKFQFNNCLRRGTTVSCSVLITNLDSDRKVEITSLADTFFNIYPPRIIDNEGNEYVPEKVELGSNTAFKKVIPTSAEIKLIKGIPTKATFHYEVPQNINKLAIVEVNYYLESEKRRKPTFKAEFRDIDITTGAASRTMPQNRRKK